MNMDSICIFKKGLIYECKNYDSRIIVFDRA